MNPNYKWQVIKKGNGKFYPRVSTDLVSPYWPWGPNELDTLEEAKNTLIKQKEELERVMKENEETLVFELNESC